MENETGIKAAMKIIGIATSIGKTGIDFAEGEKQCRAVMADFEAQIRQDQKEKDCQSITGKGLSDYDYYMVCGEIRGDN